VYMFFLDMRLERTSDCFEMALCLLARFHLITLDRESDTDPLSKHDLSNLVTIQSRPVSPCQTMLNMVALKRPWSYW
jgi:hypothetical protein